MIRRSAVPSHEMIKSRPSDFLDGSARHAARLSAAFDELLKAAEYATDLDVSIWEFAVDLPSLRRLWIGNNDLRWLVATGLISYAVETTKGSSTERTFETAGRLRFNRRTCFVLTTKGAETAKALSRRVSDFQVPSKQPEVSLAPPQSPKWDPERQELFVGEIVVKRFRVPAPSQEVILAAFEEEGWPTRIDDPLPPHSNQCPKRRLQETIRSLNRNQHDSLLRFLGDGNARGVLWEFCGSAKLFGGGLP